MMRARRRSVLVMAAAAAVALWSGPGAARADRLRILAFGDSLTAGFGLPRDKGLVPRLQAWLDARDVPATIIDGGLSGDTTYGGRVRIALSLRRHAPDAVMVELGGNDMLLGWAPERAEQNLDSILSQARAGGRKVMLIGIHAPGRDRDWRRRWAEIWPRLARRHDAVLVPDLYGPLAALPRDRRGPFLQRDGLHASARGVDLIVAALGPAVVQLVEAAGD